MNWMNLCWILDEKWRESLPRPPLSSPTPIPGCLPSLFPLRPRLSLFAVILFFLPHLLLPSRLFIRDSTLPLFIHLLCTVIPSARSFFPPFIFLRRTFWRRATKDQPTTDRPVPPSYGKYFVDRTDFQLLSAASENSGLRTGSGGNLGRVLTYTSSCVQMNVVVCACVSYGHACTHQDFTHKFQNNDVSVSLR